MSQSPPISSAFRAARGRLRPARALGGAGVRATQPAAVRAAVATLAAAIAVSFAVAGWTPVWASEPTDGCATAMPEISIAGPNITSTSTVVTLVSGEAMSVGVGTNRSALLKPTDLTTVDVATGATSVALDIEPGGWFVWVVATGACASDLDPVVERVVVVLPDPQILRFSTEALPPQSSSETAQQPRGLRLEISTSRDVDAEIVFSLDAVPVAERTAPLSRVPRSFTFDGLPDADYEVSVVLTDPDHPELATTETHMVALDTTAPELRVIAGNPLAERLGLVLQSEVGARITIASESGQISRTFRLTAGQNDLDIAAMPGLHDVVVTATDDHGNTTSHAVNVEVLAGGTDWSLLLTAVIIAIAIVGTASLALRLWAGGPRSMGAHRDLSTAARV